MTHYKCAKVVYVSVKTLLSARSFLCCSFVDISKKILIVLIVENHKAIKYRWLWLMAQQSSIFFQNIFLPLGMACLQTATDKCQSIKMIKNV